MTPPAIRRLLLCAVCALVFLPAGSALAQTTASITGTVVDESGEPLPGVNVIATHQPTGTRYGAATNPNGRYTILNVRIGGPYTVRASFVGYQTVEETGFSLSLEEKQVIDFQLRPQTAELDEVQVIAQRDPVISKTRTGAATNISEEQIQSLPTISRTISDFTRLTPQASGDGSIGGRSNRYNAIQIDGATINDVFGLGNTPGEQAGTEPISLDAIEEFNVNIAPFDVRKSGFTGGQVNAVTKSGTNEFEGLLRYRLGTENFTGDFDGVGTDDFQQEYYVGNFGGPIIKDKLFFFVNAEVRRQSSPEAVRIGDVPGPNTFQVDDSVLDQVGVSSTSELLSEVSRIADDVYNYNAGGTSPVKEIENNEKLFVKMDWNITNSHRLTLRHSFVNARNSEGLGRGNSFFDFSSQLYEFESVQNSSVVQLNSTIGTSVFNEARVVFTRIADERNPAENPFPAVEIDLGDQTVELGVGRFNQANALTQNLLEVTNDLTYTRGDHTLTAGAQFNLYDFENLFIQDYYGSYVFEGFTVGDETVSALEAFRRGQPTQYQYSYATDRADSNRPVAAFTSYQAALYVQDEWQATDALRLTGGLRVDVPLIPQEPTFNPAAEDAFGVSTSTVASGNVLWSPRFGFNYGAPLFGEGFDTQIRGGVGLFAGRPPYVFISNQYSNTGADLFRIDATFDPAEDFSTNGQYDPSESFMPPTAGDNPSNQPRPGGDNALEPVETTEINVIDEDFKYPQTLRFNLGVDQDLGNGFVATLEGIASQSINEVVYENINIQQGSTSRYGRPIYDAPAVDDRFTNALLLKNANTGYEYSLTGQIQRRLREGFTGQLAYTFTRAENVNNATSDRAISNWQFNETKDINNPRIGTADFEVRHRILGELNYRVTLLDRFTTSVGLIYEGRSGEPFSWVYNGNANSDTQNQNDLVYVPQNETDVVLTSDNWDLFNSFIEGDDALNDARGEVIRRNTATAPWQNLLDLRVTQKIKTVSGQDLEVIMDVRNVLNLVGGWVGQDDWGRIYGTNFNSVTAWNFSGYVEPRDVGTLQGGRILTTDDLGKPIISFNERKVEDKLTDELFNVRNISSRWRLRLGVRYTF